MALLNSSNDRPYREKFFASATYLYKALRYLVFVYVIGSALAITAVAATSEPGKASFSLGLVLVAYGVAALAAAILMYAFVQVLILACCAYGEWLCEQREDKDSGD